MSTASPERAHDLRVLGSDTQRPIRGCTIVLGQSHSDSLGTITGGVKDCPGTISKEEVATCPYTRATRTLLPRSANGSKPESGRPVPAYLDWTTSDRKSTRLN